VLVSLTDAGDDALMRAHAPSVNAGGASALAALDPDEAKRLGVSLD
jgi:hypothetical protein